MLEFLNRKYVCPSGVGPYRETYVLGSEFFLSQFRLHIPYAA